MLFGKGFAKKLKAEELKLKSWIEREKKVVISLQMRVDKQAGVVILWPRHLDRGVVESKNPNPGGVGERQTESKPLRLPTPA